MLQSIESHSHSQEQIVIHSSNFVEMFLVKRLTGKATFSNIKVIRTHKAQIQNDL